MRKEICVRALPWAWQHRYYSGYDQVHVLPIRPHIKQFGISRAQVILTDRTRNNNNNKCDSGYALRGAMGQHLLTETAWEIGFRRATDFVENFRSCPSQKHLKLVYISTNAK